MFEENNKSDRVAAPAPMNPYFPFLATMGGRGAGIRRSPLFNRFYVHQTLEYGRSIRWRLSHNSVFFSFHSSPNCIELYLCSSLCSHLSTVMNTEGTAQKTLIALYGLFAQIYIFAQITNRTALWSCCTFTSDLHCSALHDSKVRCQRMMGGLIAEA